MKNYIILVLLIIFSQSPVYAEKFNHSYVRIYTDGVVKQNYHLTEKEWDAIVLAVDYSLVRVQSAIDELGEGALMEATINIKSALHLLTLVKIATPTFQVHEQIDDDVNIITVQSLNIISHDGRGDERIVDVPLLRAFLTNALYAIKLKQINNTQLFLENALESSKQLLYV